MAAGRRVVVTGLGVVSSLGSDVPTFWRRCLAGDGVVAPIPDLWARAGSRPRHYAPLGAWVEDAGATTRFERKRLDPAARMALTAASRALAHAGLATRPHPARRDGLVIEGVDPARAGVYVGTGIAGFASCLDNISHVMLDLPRAELANIAAGLRELAGGAPQAERVEAVLARLPAAAHFNPFTAAMAMPNNVAANLVVKFGLHGPSPTFCCACASGTVAIGHALRAIRAGDCDVALAAGAEFLGDTYGGAFAAFAAAGALAHGPDAQQVNRPFDAGRSGFLFAEGGAAVLVLEDLERARARGAPPPAELLGYGETGDGHSLMAVAPDGAQVRRALERCLADAGLDAAAVDYVNAHGTGTPANDGVECEVLLELFGPRPWLNSTKSLLGHTMGASGAIEALVTVLSLRDGITHPCRNLVEPCAPARFVREARPIPIRHALSESFAFGGYNAVLAFGAPPSA